jgi:hypothetical protein
MPPPLVVGQLALEFRLIVEQQSLGRTQPEPPLEFDIDGILAVAVGHVAEQDQHHDDEPPEQFDLVHLDHLARWFRLVEPRFLVLGKLMVNAGLTPLRHLQAPA